MSQNVAFTEGNCSWRSCIPRFHRRVWLLLGLAAASLIGFVAWELRTDFRHRHFATELRRHSCIVEFENGNLGSTTGPIVPGDFEMLWSFYSDRRIKSVALRSNSPDALSQSLDCLKQLGAFENLMIYDAGIGEHALADLMTHIRVRTLFIQGESLPRTRIAWLNRQPLEYLCVARTEFSNPAIDDLPLSLTSFDATGTRIDDEGLASFHRLTNLKSLTLVKTPTTEEAVERLREQMPWCQIESKPKPANNRRRGQGRWRNRERSSGQEVLSAGPDEYSGIDKHRFLDQLSAGAHTSYEKIDFAEQSEEQKVFSTIWVLEAEMNNGGFWQFFWNSDSNIVEFAPTALRAIGTDECATIVDRAIEVVAPLALNAEDRRRAIEGLNDDQQKFLNSLDQEFLKDLNNLTELLYEFVQKHRRAFRLSVGR